VFERWLFLNKGKVMSDDIEVLPLPKRFFDRAVELGIAKLILSFSGGSDEGYLDVNYQMSGNLLYTKEANDLAVEVEVWADDAFRYNGAGDGSPYGDTVTYDLVHKTVEVREWFSEVVYGQTTHHSFKIDEDSQEA